MAVALEQHKGGGGAPVLHLSDLVSAVPLDAVLRNANAHTVSQNTNIQVVCEASRPTGVTPHPEQPSHGLAEAGEQASRTQGGAARHGTGDASVIENSAPGDTERASPWERAAASALAAVVAEQEAQGFAGAPLLPFCAPLVGSLSGGVPTIVSAQPPSVSVEELQKANLRRSTSSLARMAHPSSPRVPGTQSASQLQGESSGEQPTSTARRALQQSSRRGAYPEFVGRSEGSDHGGSGSAAPGGLVGSTSTGGHSPPSGPSSVSTAGARSSTRPSRPSPPDSATHHHHEELWSRPASALARGITSLLHRGDGGSFLHRRHSSGSLRIEETNITLSGPTDTDVPSARAVRNSVSAGSVLQNGTNSGTDAPPATPPLATFGSAGAPPPRTSASALPVHLESPDEGVGEQPGAPPPAFVFAVLQDSTTDLPSSATPSSDGGCAHTHTGAQPLYQSPLVSGVSAAMHGGVTAGGAQAGAVWTPQSWGGAPGGPGWLGLRPEESGKFRVQPRLPGARAGEPASDGTVMAHGHVAPPATAQRSASVELRAQPLDV